MPKYNTTVKKYNNKKKSNGKQNQTKNMDKPKTQPDLNHKVVEDNKKLVQEKQGSTQVPNPALKDSQDKNTLTNYGSNKIISIALCVIIGIITLAAILLTRPNLFTYTNNTDLWVLSYPLKIVAFILFFLALILSVCFVTFSNKTNIQAFNMDIVLYDALCLLLFTSNLLLFTFNLLIPNCIIITLLCILSIYMTYRFYISNIVSGILATFSTLCLFYCLYVSYGFVFLLA